MPNATRAILNDMLARIPKQALKELGLISAAWVYLETEVDFVIQALLVHPKAMGMHVVTSPYCC